MPILSIIIPVFNERSTVETLINKLKAVVFPGPVELIIVDDGSTDGTVEVLKQLSGIDVVLYHDYNQGKGMAIRTGLVKASGEYVVIQDADLEYDPNDLAIMLQEMIDRGLSVLYGSRNLLHGRNKSAGLTYYTGGVFLSWLTNILYGQKITDEPTCYKMFKTQLLKSLPLTCERFEFCPEVTALVALRGFKIPEISISYYPRSKKDGKKIGLSDAWQAVLTLIKCRLFSKKNSSK